MIWQGQLGRGSTEERTYRGESDCCCVAPGHDIVNVAEYESTRSLNLIPKTPLTLYE